MKVYIDISPSLKEAVYENKKSDLSTLFENNGFETGHSVVRIKGETGKRGILTYLIVGASFYVAKRFIDKVIDIIIEPAAQKTAEILSPKEKQTDQIEKAEQGTDQQAPQLEMKIEELVEAGGVNEKEEDVEEFELRSLSKEEMEEGKKYLVTLRAENESDQRND